MWKSRSERLQLPLRELASNVAAFLHVGAELASRAGVARERILLDPGPGAGVAAGKNESLPR